MRLVWSGSTHAQREDTTKLHSLYQPQMFNYNHKQQMALLSFNFLCLWLRLGWYSPRSEGRKLGLFCLFVAFYLSCRRFSFWVGHRGGGWRGGWSHVWPTVGHPAGWGVDFTRRWRLPCPIPSVIVRRCPWCWSHNAHMESLWNNMNVLPHHTATSSHLMGMRTVVITHWHHLFFCFFYILYKCDCSSEVKHQDSFRFRFDV